jgi:hypothetical protein
MNIIYDYKKDNVIDIETLIKFLSVQWLFILMI